MSLRLDRFAWIVLALLLGGCSGTTVSGWSKHQDPLGFVVEHPPGWKVSVPNGEWIQIEKGDETSFAVAYPFFLNQPAAAGDCVRGVPQLLVALLPKVNVAQVRQQSAQPDQATASLSFQRNGLPYVGKAFCGIVGASATFFAIAAPQAQFEAERQTLGDVINTLYFTQPQKPASPDVRPDANIGYVRWYDPRENAFNTEVPGGWRVDGGSFRAGAIDIRYAISLTSIDGLIRITAGDPQVGFFFSPGLMSMMMGIGFSSCYDPGYGYCIPIKMHQTGLQFVKEYVNTTVASWCPNVAITSEQPRPDMAKAINDAGQQYLAMGAHIQATSGEVGFTCQMNGQPVQGYYFASTEAWSNLNILDGSSQWSVPHLYGYVAPVEQVALARSVIQRGVQAFQMNPQWVATQQQTTGAVSGIVANTGQQVSQIFNDSFWSTQGVNAEVYRKWSNQTLGLVNVRDPVDGTERRVEAGNRNYLRVMTTGAIVGTDEDVQESFDVRRLILLD